MGFWLFCSFSLCWHRWHPFPTQRNILTSGKILSFIVSHIQDEMKQHVSRVWESCMCAFVRDSPAQQLQERQLRCWCSATEMLVRAECSQSSRDHPDTVTIHNCNGYQPRQQKIKASEGEREICWKYKFMGNTYCIKIKNAVQKHNPWPLHRNEITSRGLVLFQNKHRIGIKVLKSMF